MKIEMTLVALCVFGLTKAVSSEELVRGYGTYQLSSRFNTCIAKKLHNKTFAQQELECLQEELKEVKEGMDTTYQGLMTLMKKNHWEDRLKNLQIAQKEFDGTLNHLTESTAALYGSRMAGFARLYETIDYIELRRKHLQHLLEYYGG
jgi:hypothetical protein